jgi:hypothetical protein
MRNRTEIGDGNNLRAMAKRAVATDSDEVKKGDSMSWLDSVGDWLPISAAVAVSFDPGKEVDSVSSRESAKDSMRRTRAGSHPEKSFDLVSWLEYL